MKPTLSIISGWAHGLQAIQPIGDAMEDRFKVKLMTGAKVLNDRHIPDSDFIITGSMGGLLAMELMLASCRKLVLISSTAKFCADGDYPHGTHEKVLCRMILQLERNPATVLDDFFKNVHHPFRESRAAMVARKHVMQDMDDLIAGLDYLLRSDVRENVSSIDIPVLLLHGTEDRIIPVGAAEWLHAHLPDSHLIKVEGDGHALPAHHFETVMRAIRRFLQPDD